MIDNNVLYGLLLRGSRLRVQISPYEPHFGYQNTGEKTLDQFETIYYRVNNRIKTSVVIFAADFQMAYTNLITIYLLQTHSEVYLYDNLVWGT